jgi:hypothetical protein
MKKEKKRVAAELQLHSDHGFHHRHHRVGIKKNYPKAVFPALEPKK